MLLAAALAAACGSSRPTTPSPVPSPTSPSPVLDLTSGSYDFALTMATTGTGTCTGPFCASITLCIGVSEAAPLVSITVPTPVKVERTGDSIVIRPDDPSSTFRMDLKLAKGTLSGTASGRYRSAGTAVQVDGGSPGVLAVVSGTPPTDFVVGSLNGSITIGDITCSSNGHNWTLRRPLVSPN